MSRTEISRRTLLAGGAVLATTTLLPRHAAAAGRVVAPIYPGPWEDVILGGLLALMPGIALIDLRHQIIPNKLTYPAMLLVLSALFFVALAGHERYAGRLALTRGIRRQA